MLNRIEEKLPSTSDIARADEIKLQEFTENAARSMKNLIEQLEGSEDLPMCKLIGLDKQLRSIRDSLKVEVAEKVQLEQHARKVQARENP